MNIYERKRVMTYMENGMIRTSRNDTRIMHKNKRKMYKDEQK